MYWKPEVYKIENAGSVFSPGLLIFSDLVKQNLVEMIRIAGGPERLRPHCKTHKTQEVVKIALELGVTRHKCATIAEAEMLADAGVKDILVAYQMVGPNLLRILRLAQKYPDVEFSTLVDHPRAVTQLSRVIHEFGDSGVTIKVLVDLNSGMNRTGISIGPRAIELYEMIYSSDVLNIGGLHWYDGQHRQCDLIERTGAGTLYLDRAGLLGAESRKEITRLMDAENPIRLIASSEPGVELSSVFGGGWVQLKLPPIRERTEDLAELITRILMDLQWEMGEFNLRRVDAAALEKIRSFPFSTDNLTEVRRMLVWQAMEHPKQAILREPDLPDWMQAWARHHSRS